MVSSVKDLFYINTQNLTIADKDGNEQDQLNKSIATVQRNEFLCARNTTNGWEVYKWRTNRLFAMITRLFLAIWTPATFKAKNIAHIQFEYIKTHEIKNKKETKVMLQVLENIKHGLDEKKDIDLYNAITIKHQELLVKKKKKNKGIESNLSVKGDCTIKKLERKIPENKVRLIDILNDPSFCDVCLVSKDGNEFPIHSSLLCDTELFRDLVDEFPEGTGDNNFKYKFDVPYSSQYIKIFRKFLMHQSVLKQVDELESFKLNLKPSEILELKIFAKYTNNIKFINFSSKY